MEQITNRDLTQLAFHIRGLVAWLDAQSGTQPAVSDDVHSQIAERIEKRRCLLCNEPYKGKMVRGVHNKPCYQKLKYLFRRGTLTENMAIAKGWLVSATYARHTTMANDPLAPYFSKISAEPQKQKRLSQATKEDFVKELHQAKDELERELEEGKTPKRRRRKDR